MNDFFNIDLCQPKEHHGICIWANADCSPPVCSHPEVSDWDKAKPLQVCRPKGCTFYEYKKKSKRKERELKLKLSELKDLPIFGSMEWWDGGTGALKGTMGLFSIGDGGHIDKYQIIQTAIEDGEALIMETVSVGEGYSVFHMKPVQVINDEENDSWWNVRVFYHCACGKKEVKVLSGHHLSKIIEAADGVVCIDCNVQINVEIREKGEIDGI